MPILKKLPLVVLATLSMLTISACGNDNANAQTTKVATTKATQAPNATQASGEHADIMTALQSNLTKTGINATVTSVTPIAMPDMYLANIENMPPVFTDKTGTYIIQGTLISLADDKPVDISELAMSAIAKNELSNADPSEMIIYKAKGETKSIVYVFSDPTCHYCQLLHKDMDTLNASGLEVRYLAWPRGEQTIPLTEAVWCSADRHQALTDAKAGKMPHAATCDNPVKKHIDLGFKLGVSGTPAIFTSNGQQIVGYLPPNELVNTALQSQ